MRRTARVLLSVTVAASVLLAPTAAGASDENIAVATNQIDGTAVVSASVQYRKAASGTVDEVNIARAVANCVDCKTFAAAFQLVLVTKEPDRFDPSNEAFALNVACDGCVTWASAKQVLVATGGPASLSEAGHARMAALEDRLRALDVALPDMTLVQLLTEVDAAFGELLAIAAEEIVGTDDRPNDAKVVAIRSS